MDVNLMRILPPFDENAAYEDDEAEDPDPKTGPVNIDLYEQKDEGGALKSYMEGSQSDQIILSQERSGSNITVERLVWVDGFRQTTGVGTERQHQDAMTLVVLKLGFHTRRSSMNGTIGFAEAELIFQSVDKGGRGPRVVAWGPFRHPEAWNVSTAEHKTGWKAEAGASAGLGPQFSVGAAREGETSWEQVYFDQGASTRLFNRTTEQPHGVRWNLQENQKCKSGVDPEIRIAVLISRAQPSQPYMVTFRIATQRGTVGAWLGKSQTLLGMRGGKEVRWRATPNTGNKDACYDEGRHIVESIDLENLGKLMDADESTNLTASWLRPYRFEIPNPGLSSELPVNTAAGEKGNFSVDAENMAEVRLASPMDDGITTDKITQSLRPVGPDTGVPGTAAYAKSNAGPTTHKPETPFSDTAVPSLFLPPSGADHQGYSRLLSLEVRAAQAEARLASQETLILKLQRDLARMEQLVSAVIHPA